MAQYFLWRPRRNAFVVFFRSYEEMPDLEKMALSVCEGRILDVGAGTGCHSLVLQHFDNEVTAIDTAAHAVSVMKESGLKNVLHQDFFELENQSSIRCSV